MTGVKPSTPYIPRAVTENVPPSTSDSRSFPPRAAEDSREVSVARSVIDKRSAPRTTAVSYTHLTLPTILRV